VALTEQNWPSQTFDLVARSRNLPVLRQHGSENTRHATRPIHTARLEGADPAPSGNRSIWVEVRGDPHNGSKAANRRGGVVT